MRVITQSPVVFVLAWKELFTYLGIWSAELGNLTIASAILVDPIYVL